MNDNHLIDIFGNTFGAILTAIQENPILQWIEFALMILSISISIGYRIYKWIRSAKEDGKIDKKEVEELIDIVGESAEEVKDAINKKEGDKNGK